MGNATSFPARRRTPASVNQGSSAGTSRDNVFSFVSVVIAVAFAWVNTPAGDAGDAGDGDGGWIFSLEVPLLPLPVRKTNTHTGSG